MTFEAGHNPSHDVTAAGRKGKSRSPWRHSRTTAPAERAPDRGDPRIEPAEGDAVRVGNETREVEMVNRDKVIYSWPGKLAVRTLSMKAWRAWAADGQPVRVSAR